MKNRIVPYCLACCFAAVVSGCSSYYKVTDPLSNKVYYTNSLEKKPNGIVEFNDEASETHVTLMGAEVTEITKRQYKENMQSQ